jgi:hypothetical protein
MKELYKVSQIWNDEDQAPSNLEEVEKFLSACFTIRYSHLVPPPRIEAHDNAKRIDGCWTKAGGVEVWRCPNLKAVIRFADIILVIHNGHDSSATRPYSMQKDNVTTKIIPSR